MASLGHIQRFFIVLILVIALTLPATMIESANVIDDRSPLAAPPDSVNAINVTLSCDENTSTIRKGDSHTYIINVTNTGPVSDTINLSINNPTDWRAHFNDNRPDQVIAQEEAVSRLATTYRNYSGTVAEIYAIEAAHPDIAEVSVIGVTWEGRDIPCVKVSDNVSVDESEPEVLIMGLHHAREWMSVEVPMYFLNNLVDNYGSDPQATWNVNNREIFIVPIVNPDGLVYAQTVGDWRKNRRDNGDGSYGVDLNRNYDGAQNGDPNGDWGMGSGTSHTPSNEVYCGPSAFSEPETQAIRDLVLARDFQVTISYHSYGREIYWPWGYSTSVQSPHHATQQAIAEGLAAENGYTPMQSAVAYPTTGDTDDWVYGYNWYQLGRFISAHTIELDGSFHPPVSQIDITCELNLGANFFATETAENLNLDSPVIDHLPYQDTYDITGPYAISADITTPHSLVPGATKMFWKTTGAWSEVAMTNTVGDTWQADIPGQVDNTWVSYYIETEDINGHITTHPKYVPYTTHDFHVGNDVTEYSIDLEPSEWQIIEFMVEAPDTALHSETAVIDVIGTSSNDPTDSDSIETVTSILPGILLVDDDNDEIGEYRDALDNNGYSYMEVRSSTLSNLVDYDVVIWATDNTNTLSATERTRIQEYLEGGGNLYINGEDIGWQADNEGWLGWYHTYLHADFITDDSNTNVINGVPGDEITDGMSDRTISGNYPSEIEPWDGFASTIFTYAEAGDPAGAVKADTGTYKVVYLAFEYFEGFIEPQVIKDLLMRRIIEWLMPEPPTYDIPVLATPGWNFISFPLRATGPIDEVLNDSAGDDLTDWDMIRWFDPDGAEWKTYATFMPPELCDLQYVHNKFGLWVHITDIGDGFLTIQGPQPTSTVISMSDGWNLVGYPSTKSENAAATLPASADVVAIFDEFDPYLISDEPPAAVSMEAGNAYWVHCVADDVWIVNW